MKRLIVCGLIVAGLIMLAIGSYLYIINVSAETLNKLVLVKEAYEAEDGETALKRAGEAESEWQGLFRCGYFIIDTEYIAEITDGISRIKSLAENDSEDLPIECDGIINLLTLYKGKQDLSLKNIM